MTDEHEPAMRITLRDLYREQQEMKGILQQLASSLPSTVERLHDHEKRSQEKFDDHEKRIRLIEGRVWKAIGGFGLVAAAMPFLVRFL